jgi:indole-3-glycerol phosphate synthase
VAGNRRLSQAISEGDGISVLVEVADAAAAAAAESQGAEGLSLTKGVSGVRDATSLPVLLSDGSPEDAQTAGADAWLLVFERVHDELLEDLYGSTQEFGLECVVDVRDEEELELVLQRIDPEIFLLSSREADDEGGALGRVLELLPDVPAGKLAIAELRGATPQQVSALERAGVDAVLVAAGDLAAVMRAQPPMA